MNPQNETEKTASLQHEKKMPLRERMEESQAYGEKYRAEHAGPDEREAVKPLHPERNKSDSVPLKDADEGENPSAV